MRLEDALFNWLQIKLVAEARPQDHAAQETLAFFSTILEEDHHLSDVRAVDADEWIHIHYIAEGTGHSRKFDREYAEKLLADIEAEPKYNS